MSARYSPALSARKLCGSSPKGVPGASRRVTREGGPRPVARRASRRVGEGGGGRERGLALGADVALVVKRQPTVAVRRDVTWWPS